MLLKIENFIYNGSAKQHCYSLFLIGLFIRTVRSLLYNDITPDAVLYVTMANEWIGKGADAAFKVQRWIPPLWPYLLRCGDYLGLSPEMTGTVIGVTAGSVVSLCGYNICMKLFKRKEIAVLAGVILCAHPILVRYSVERLRDSLYIPLFAVAIALLVHMVDSKKIILWLAYAVVSAFAVMTRREGTELLIFPAGIVFVLFFSKQLTIRSFSLFAAKYCTVTVMFFTLTLWTKSLLSGTCSDWSPIDKTLQPILGSIMEGKKYGE